MNTKKFVLIQGYDLQGLEVTSSTLSWAPFLTIDDCDETGRNCKKNFGYLGDYMEFIAGAMNFTLVSYQDVDRDWGVVPKSGPYNRSGEWGGVMGDVIMGNKDLSLSAWAWLPSRYGLLDFTPIAKRKLVIMWTPKNPETGRGHYFPCKKSFTQSCP